MTTRKDVLDKVIKLLALSENNSETNEAQAAKNMAAKLMAQYDIKISEAKEKPRFEERVDDLNTKNPPKYDMILKSQIAKFNGVAFVVSKRISNSSYIYIGRSADIEHTLYMSDVIYQQRNAKWKEYLKSLPKRTVSQRGKLRRTWRMGFTIGVTEKLRTITEMKENNIQEKGLTIVPLNVQALNDYKSRCNNLGSSKYRSSNYSAAGIQAGRSTLIHEGINKQSSVKQIG